MPLIQPDFEDIALKVLKPSVGLEEKQEQKAQLLDILNNNGASLDAAARRVASLVNFPENEQNGLRAAELIFRANGLLRDLEKEKKEVPEINITIIGSNNDNVVQLLMPK